MRPEYDLRGGVRGKYYERYKQGTNVVLLEPDIAKVFRDSATVNEALREAIRAVQARGIKEFFGSGLWDGNLAQMREDRNPPKRK